MARIDLCTIISGTPAGLLTQDDKGVMSFRYYEDYDGTPLSVSMPLSNRTYGQDVVRPYLFGLLPDSEEQRIAIAREYDGRPNNPVTMLAHIGLDCPGAVQFCAPDLDTIRSVVQRPATYEPLSDEEIAQRLVAIRSDREDSWVAGGESWSLGGNQGKFALALHDGHWCSCQGSAPTTHIFKNGVRGFRLQALDEFVCMRTAAAVGLSAADVEYRDFAGEPALIIARYDRAVCDGRVVRLHQEDACQALSRMPYEKYTSDGGPTTKDVQMLLGRSCTDVAAALRTFTQCLFFNYLIGAPDAHAKNYSLRLEGGSAATLAPLYDVASGFPYERERGDWRLAMAIGGENRFFRVGRGAVERYAGKNDPEVADLMIAAGLGADTCTSAMAELAGKVPKALDAVFDQCVHVEGADELRSRMLDKVTRNCESTLALL